MVRSTARHANAQAVRGARRDRASARAAPASTPRRSAAFVFRAVSTTASYLPDARVALLGLVPSESTQPAAEQQQREAADRHQGQIRARERERALLLGRRQARAGHSAGALVHLRLDRRNDAVARRLLVPLDDRVLQGAAQVGLRVVPVQPSVVLVVLVDLLRCRRECPRHPDDGRTRQSGNCCENPSPTHLPLPSMYRSLASYNDSSAAIGTPPHFSVLLPSSDSCRLPKLPPWEPPVSSLDVG